MSAPNKVTVGNTTTYWYYNTTASKWVESNNAVTYTSFDVTAANVIMYYTETGSTAVKSQTYAFSKVTEEMVGIMQSMNIQYVIDFVNYSTDGSDTVILTDAQMKAIEYVLEHDFGVAS